MLEKKGIARSVQCPSEVVFQHPQGFFLCVTVQHCAGPREGLPLVQFDRRTTAALQDKVFSRSEANMCKLLKDDAT